jgi:type II secretory pathway component PulM
MRIAQTYLEQLAGEVRQLNRQASAAERSGQHDDAERLRVEATARQTKLTRLQAGRSDGVRFG